MKSRHCAAKLAPPSFELINRSIWRFGNRLAFLLTFLVLSAPTQASVAVDTSGFNPVLGDCSSFCVRAMAEQPDGKILVIGQFTSVNGTVRNRLARLNADGSADTEFNPNAVVRDAPNAIAIQPDGKILIGSTSVIRLNTDGSLDTSFTSDRSTSGLVRTLALQPNGKILIGGDFTNIGNTPRSGLARLNTDGSLDPAFRDPGFQNIESSLFEKDVIINSIQPQPDGKLLVGGEFTSADGESRSSLVRLNTDGDLDRQFAPQIGFEDPTSDSPKINSITLQRDGNILIAGLFRKINDVPISNLARLNPDGRLDTAFDTGSAQISLISSIYLQANGKILVGSQFVSIDGILRTGIIRFNANGSLDLEFNAGSIRRSTTSASRADAILQRADGNIVIGGSFTTVNGQPRTGIALLNPNGRLDNGFNPDSGANEQVSAFSQSLDGKVLIGGNFTRVDGTAINRIAQLELDGTLDANFDPGTGANDEVLTIAKLPNGKAILGGGFTSLNSIENNRIARINADGSLDTEFNRNLGTGANGTVRSIAVQTDGKILIAGTFTSVNGLPRNRIARLSADGTVDALFQSSPSGGANNTINSIALQPDGKVLIGGIFTNINGLSRNRIARLNSDGSLDTTFDPGEGADLLVFSVALQADGKVLIGGSFNNVNGVPREGIARFNPNGTLDSSFNAGENTDGGINSITLQADGKILISGSFTRINGTARNRIARLNRDGSLDTGFNLGSGANSFVSAIAQQADGKILIGGGFTSVNGVSRNRIARLVTDEAALQALKSDVEGRAVKWLRGGASPELVSVSFEVADSLDGVWLPLGAGQRIAGGWQTTGLNLPKDKNIFIRARGVYRGGLLNGSQSITESVQQLFLAQAVNDELCLPIKAKNGKFAVICL